MTDTTMNNTTMHNTTLNNTGNLTLNSILGTTEFPPLSQRLPAPGQKMSNDNPADNYVLEKQSPSSMDQEGYKAKKDLNMLIPESDEMMKTGLHQARHANAISSELKLLLENEKKVLDQLMKRCNKFTQLKEENKKESLQWHDDHIKRLPQIEANQFKLISYLDEPALDAEGISSQVQQKILFEIVSRTSAAANNILVQLSMENTIINDIDLTLLDLKKHGSVMLKQISKWLKFLVTQDEHQKAVVERWGLIGQNLKDITQKPKMEGDSAPEDKGIMQHYDDRLRRVEEALMQCCGSPAVLPQHTSPELFAQCCPRTRSMGILPQQTSPDLFSQCFLSNEYEGVSPHQISLDLFAQCHPLNECGNISPQQQLSELYARCPRVGQPTNIVSSCP